MPPAAMSARENYLAAIRFASPDHVPLGSESVQWSFQFEGNFRKDDWTDAWGVGWEVGIADTVPFPRHNPLPDLDRLDDYPIPDPDRLAFTEELRSALAAVDRRQHVVYGSLAYLLFERAWAIMGLEGFLAALVTHPGPAHAFLHAIARYARRVFERYLELGVDGIRFSEDLGSQRALMLSPAMVREFLVPEYRFMFAPVLAAGKIVNFHSCGCIESVAGDLAGIGITVLNPVQARANDLRAVKQATFARTALQGGIDTDLLIRGTPAEVRTETERVMALLKPGGGYVCQPDQSIPGIPPENLEALWTTAQAVGRY
jgi:uroporphyrinogen decarboxylase